MFLSDVTMVSMVTSVILGQDLKLVTGTGAKRFWGLCKGFLGFEIRDFGIVLGKKIVFSILG